MPIHFQGSGFSLDLPDHTVDATAYVFMFPTESGDSMPSLSIRVERRRQSVDLLEYVQAQREPATGASSPPVRVVKEKLYGHRERPYVVSLTDWGEGEATMRRKEIFLMVPGEVTTIYRLTATELASKFAAAEALLDGVMRSFRPNDLQLVPGAFA